MNRSELIDKHIEDIEANSSEVEKFVDDLESDIARLYCIHRNNPEEFGRLVNQMIDIQVNIEAVYRAEQELSDD